MRERRSAIAAFAATVPAVMAMWIMALYVYTHATGGPGLAAARLPYMIMGGVLFDLPVVPSPS